jgi:RNA polymerase sigma factor (sigma-70 family)
MRRAGDIDGIVRALEPVARAAITGLYADGHDRDDLLQHARLGIVEAVRDHKGRPDGLPGFAHMVARRRVLHLIEASNRHNARALTDSARFDARLDPAGHRSVEQDVIDRAEARELLGIVGRLPATQRAAFILTEFAGLQRNQAARRLALNPMEVNRLLAGVPAAVRVRLREHHGAMSGNPLVAEMVSEALAAKLAAVEALPRTWVVEIRDGAPVPEEVVRLADVRALLAAAQGGEALAA